MIPVILGSLCTGALAQTGPVVKWQEEGLRFEVAPLGLDQVRGFFIGRGFSAENADFLAAKGCVFRSAIGNAGTSKSDPAVELDLSKWSIQSSAGNGVLRVREKWQSEWKTRGVSEEAQTAFYYALFPTRQSFGPTDYNWGMISFALPPGTLFDLEVHWRTGGKPFSKQIRGLKCGQ